MQDQIDRLTSIRNAIANATNFGGTMPNCATREYDTIKTSLMRTAEGTRAWEKYCNQNGYYSTHTSQDFLEGTAHVSIASTDAVGEAERFHELIAMIWKAIGELPPQSERRDPVNWESLRELCESIRLTSMMATMPREVPIRLMDGTTHGIYPYRGGDYLISCKVNS